MPIQHAIAGGFKFWVHKPDYPHSGIVDHYLLLEGSSRNLTDRLFPQHHTEIMINLTTHKHRAVFNSGASFGPFTNSTIGGIRDTFCDITTAPYCSLAVIRFTLFGFSWLTRLPAMDFSNALVDAESVLGKDIQTLRDQLLECTQAQGKFMLLHQWVNKLAARQDIHELSQWNRLEAVLRDRPAEGLQSGLKSLMGFSHKHVIELFKRHVGLTPKKINAVYRLSKVLSDVNQGAGNLGQLCYEAGYADQSHMNRDFKKSTGLRPVELRKKIFTDICTR